MTADAELHARYHDLLAGGGEELVSVVSQLHALLGVAEPPPALARSIMQRATASSRVSDRSAGLPAHDMRPVRSLPVRDTAILDAEVDLRRARHPQQIGFAASAMRLAAVVVAFAVIGIAGWYVTRFQAPGPRQVFGVAQAITWNTGAVQLTGDSLMIGAGDRSFFAPAQVDLNSDPGSPTSRTLEAVWFEGETEMRLNLYFAADAASWWVSEIRTYNGILPVTSQDWIYYYGTLFTSPLGDVWTGDVDLASSGGPVPGTLTIRGLRLRAFAPGSIAGVIDDCILAAPEHRDQDALAPGLPLAGSHLDRMTPAAADAWLDARNLCHAFDYSYRVADDHPETAPPTGQVASEWWRETWCDPPDGVIAMVRYGRWGQVVVYVEDRTGRIRPMRPQPLVGWGCPGVEPLLSPSPSPVPSPSDL